MGTGSALMDGVGTLVSFLFSIVGAGLGLDGLSALYTAYKRACMRLDDERWLLENCREPLFFSKMRAHTTVCSEVEANARVGAFWTALREVTDAFKITWQPGPPPASGPPGGREFRGMSGMIFRNARRRYCERPA